jgi:cytochrome oxidase Cu insertion factor (SCO1/SenC/PrrC family)
MRRPGLNTTARAMLVLASVLAVGCQDQGGPAHVVTGPVPESLDFQVHSIDGEPVNLARYLGKVVVVVNIASR